MKTALTAEKQLRDEVVRAAMDRYRQVLKQFGDETLRRYAKGLRGRQAKLATALIDACAAYEERQRRKT